MKKSKNRLICSIICLVLVGFCCILGVTGAYFKFSKSFTSSGDLPVLNITGTATSTSDFVTISGASSQFGVSTRYIIGSVDLNVKISTTGNNLNGSVRCYALISWEDGLSNVKNGEKVCELVYNSDIWELRENSEGIKHYYLKSGFLEPNEEVQLFTQIKFNENYSETYGNKTVEIMIVSDIHQTTNLPANW